MCRFSIIVTYCIVYAFFFIRKRKRERGKKKKIEKGERREKERKILRRREAIDGRTTHVYEEKDERLS